MPKDKGKLYTLIEGDMNPIWQRQPWDTDASFQGFLFYLKQVIPRSVTRAYREVHPAKAGVSQAPQNWYRWSSGKDGKNRRKRLQIIHKDGTATIRDCYTWEERAQAFDDAAVAKELDKIAEERAKLIQDAQIAVKGAYQRILVALNNWNYQGESLPDIMRSLKGWADIADKVYGGLFDEEKAQEEEQATGEAKTTVVPGHIAGMTENEKFAEFMALASKVYSDDDP